MPRSRHRDGRGKQARHARKLRRNNKSLKRSLRRVATGGKQAYGTLLAVLTQHGGEITITKSTLEQVQASYDDLGFRVEPVPAAEGQAVTEFKVILVQGESPEETPGTTDADQEQHDAA